MRARCLLATLLLLACAVPGAAHAGPSALRVLTFNIHAGTGADGRLDLARTAEVIRAGRADVVGLQEVDVHWSARSGYADQAAELARRTGMRVFFAPIYDLEPEPGRTERRRFGVAILSRHPIVETRNHLLTRLPSVDPDPVPRPMPGFAEAVLNVGGRRVHAYATHLDYRPDPAVRRTQVAETVRILGEDRPGSPQVLLGDLNAGPDAPELGPLFARIPDAWRAVHGEPGGHTYPATEPVKRIDYVTTAGPVRPVAADVPVTTASDHRPVLVTLRPR